MKKILWLIVFALQIVYAQPKVNSAHLDFLYKDVSVSGNLLGIVNIYCEAPDYHVVEAGSEGYTCVDDIARAAVFYNMCYSESGSAESLRKTVNLCRTIVHMQNNNGWFNNFLLKDNSINTEYKTSVAEPGWWTWRALWSLAVCYDSVKLSSPALADSMLSSLNSTINLLMPLYTNTGQLKIIAGLQVPDWLPYGCASDQAAVLVKALTAYYRISKRDSVVTLINSLCSGIVAMQITESGSPFYGLFRSWENSWHAWGNSQADALLDAFSVTHNSNLLASALLEINNAYRIIKKNGYFSEIRFTKNPDGKLEAQPQKYPQIAYGIRPMIWACVNAYRITKEEKYRIQAVELAKWYSGVNAVSEMMYDEKTGRCFDGIESDAKINRNSGAESTIEALLALSALEQVNH